MADYDIALEAEQIETALQQVHGADLVPTAASDNMVRSGGVAQQFQTESTARIAGDAALDERVTPLENNAMAAAIWSRPDGTHGSDFSPVTGWVKESDPENFTSESGGIITVTGAGTYQVCFSGEYYEDDNDNSDYFRVEYRADSLLLLSEIVNETQIVISGDYKFLGVTALRNPSSSFTLRADFYRFSNTSLTWRNLYISILKLA